MNDTETLDWVVESLLTESQLDTVPPGEKRSLRFRVTSRFDTVLTRDDFKVVRAKAKEWLKKNPNSDRKFGLYLLILSRNDDDFIKRLKESFSPVVSMKKILNGQRKRQGIQRVLDRMRMTKRELWFDNKCLSRNEPLAPDWRHFHDMLGDEPVSGYYEELGMRTQRVWAKKYTL